MKDIFEIFKALGDETRFKIFCLISKRRICVKGLALTLDVSESAVSQHLKVLREAGLIVGERRGHFMHYHVRPEAVDQLVTRLQELMVCGLGAESMAEILESRKVCSQVCDHRGEGCVR